MIKKWRVHRRGRFAGLFVVVMMLTAAIRAAERNDVNVLLITLDTMRADCIGAAGNPEVHTPNIDALCRGGVFFRRAYAPVPLTLPSHASIMTGRYPPAHRVRINGRHRLDGKEDTLAEILRRHGYLTHAVIASYVLQAQFGTDQGFYRYDDGLTVDDGTDKPSAEIPADRVYQKFSRWLESCNDRLFFTWLHFYDPHMPYSPPAAFIRKGFEKNQRKLYLGEIENVDLNIGRIVKDLRERNLLDRTLIVLAGDHGEAFGEHHEYGHTVFGYEENLRVPLIFFHPGLAGIRIVDEPVCLVDVLPTVTDLLGIPASPAVQGISLRPFFSGDMADGEREIYFESLWGSLEKNWAPLTGIVFRGVKFIDLPDAELYDLNADPAERYNLSRRKFKLSGEYRKRLQKFLSAFCGGTPVSASPDEEGLKKLSTLGYISDEKAIAIGNVDPKRGIILKNKLDRLSGQIARCVGLEEAEAELLAVMNKTPELKSPELYDLLFRIYFVRSKPQSALRLCKDGVKTFPGSLRVRTNMMTALMMVRDYRGAMAQCHEMIKIAPRSVGAYLALADIHHRLGEMEAALEDCRRALEIEPENMAVRKRLSELMKLNPDRAAGHERESARQTE